VIGSGISWAICKSAPRSRQITTPVPHHSVFYRPHALSATQPTASKHWRPILMANMVGNHFDQLLINVACVCVYVIVCRSSRPASWRHTWDQFTARWTTRCDDVNSCLMWDNNSLSRSWRRAKMLVSCLNDQGPDLQNILRQSCDNLTIMPKLRSTSDRRLNYKTSYKKCKAFLGYD